MTLFDLVAKLTLDSSEYEQGLDGARGKANKFAKGLNSATDKVLKVGGAAAGVAVAGMGAFAKSAVSAGKDFDASMAQVAATMGTTVGEIGELREFAQKMGAETAFSANEAAQALNYMALAGYDAKTSMAMLPSVLNLAAAGNMDLAAASDMVTDSQSALGLSLDETNDLVDKMARASSKSNTSVSQLGDAILTVGGTAKNLKGGTTELATALGLLADNGVKGAEGGTALRNILLSLTPKSEEAAKAMEAIGLQAYDAEGNMRSLEDIFTDMGEAMDGMSTQKRQNLLSSIFNKVDLKSVNALLATSKSRWDELGGAIDESAGAANAMAETQLDNLNGDITIMQSALEGVKLQFSDGITPAIRGVVQMITKALSRPRTQKFLKEVGKRLGEVITVIAKGVKNAIPKLLSLFDDGAKKLKILAGFVGGLVLAIKATVNPIGAALSGLGLLAGSLAIAGLAADDARTRFGKLTDAEQDLRDAGIDQIDSFGEIKEAREKNMRAIDEETKKTQDLWDELQTLVDKNGKVKDGYEDRVDYITGELNDALGLELERNGQIVQGYKDQAKEIDNLIQKRKAERRIEAGEEAYNAAKESLQEYADSIEVTEREIANLEESLRKERAKTAVSEGYYSPEAMEQWAEEHKENIQAIESAISDAKKDLQSYVDAESDAYHEISTYDNAIVAAEEGRYKDVNAIFDSEIRDRWRYKAETGRISKEELAELKRQADSALKAADRYRRELLNGNKDYNQETLSAMEKNAADLVEIWSDASGESYRAGKEVIKAANKGMRDGLIGMVDAGANAIAGFIRGMKSKVDDVTAVAGSISGRVVGTIRNTMQIQSPSKVMREIGQYVDEGLVLGMEDGMDAIGRTAEDAADSVIAPFDGKQPEGYTAQANKGGGSVLDSLLAVLLEIRDNMGSNIVLDDGTLVGRVDKMLGRQSLAKARGN